MLGFKPRISGVGSDHSSICATTKALRYNNFWHWLGALFPAHLFVEAEDDNPEVAVQAWTRNFSCTGLKLDKHVKLKGTKYSQTLAMVHNPL